MDLGEADDVPHRLSRVSITFFFKRRLGNGLEWRYVTSEITGHVLYDLIAYIKWLGMQSIKHGLAQNSSSDFACL